MELVILCRWLQVGTRHTLNGTACLHLPISRLSGDVFSCAMPMTQPAKRSRPSSRNRKGITHGRKRLFSCEICILAGGLSSRMGRDKARLRLGRRTLLGHVRALGQNMKCPCRVIRRDLLPRCGPLGGVYTALKTTRADAVLFLACDMPFVSPRLLCKIMKRSLQTPVLFTQSDAAGFPFILPRVALSIVEKQLSAKGFSLQALARELEATVFHPTSVECEMLFNVNTPADWEKARRLFSKRS